MPRRFSAWLFFAAWVAVIFTLSSMPSLDTSSVGIPLADKFAHMGVYGVLGALFARAAGLSRAAVLRTVLVSALVGLAVGITDELYQAHVPGRQTDALDALADLTGAGCGGLVWRAWARRRVSRL